MRDEIYPNVYEGASASLRSQVSADDVKIFASLTGDTNPVHTDEDFAAGSPFGRPIAHGILVAGFISGVLGSVLPGPGAIYLGQTLNFRAPVYVGDTVTATVTVTKIREDKPIVTLRTVCLNESNQVVIEGEAVMLCPRPIRS